MPLLDLIDSNITLNSTLNLRCGFGSKHSIFGVYFKSKRTPKGKGKLKNVYGDVVFERNRERWFLTGAPETAYIWLYRDEGSPRNPSRLLHS